MTSPLLMYSRAILDQVNEKPQQKKGKCGPSPTTGVINRAYRGILRADSTDKCTGSKSRHNYDKAKYKQNILLKKRLKFFATYIT